MQWVVDTEDNRLSLAGQQPGCNRNHLDALVADALPTGLLVPAPPALAGGADMGTINRDEAFRAAREERNVPTWSEKGIVARKAV